MTVKSVATAHRLKTRIDQDGTTIIAGRMGHIYEHDAGVFGVLIMPTPPRKQYWGFARRELLAAGFEIRQDGDGEGPATFDPSNPRHVRAAIRAVKVKPRRIPSQRQLEHLATLDRTRDILTTGAPCAVGTIDKAEVPPTPQQLTFVTQDGEA